METLRSKNLLFLELKNKNTEKIKPHDVSSYLHEKATERGKKHENWLLKTSHEI